MKKYLKTVHLKTALYIVGFSLLAPSALAQFSTDSNAPVTGSADDVDYRPNLTVFSCLLYTSPSPRDQRGSRMPSSA